MMMIRIPDFGDIRGESFQMIDIRTGLCYACQAQDTATSVRYDRFVLREKRLDLTVFQGGEEEALSLSVWIKSSFLSVGYF